MIRLRFLHLPLAAAPLASLAMPLLLYACGGAVFTVAPGSPHDDDAGGLDAGARDAGAEAAPPFCPPADAGVYDFCSDFDEAPLPENWNNLSKSGGGTLAEDSTASTSPPRSLLATTPELDAPASDAGARPTAVALIQKTGLAKGETHIAFDMRVDELTFQNPQDPLAGVVPLVYTQGVDYILVLAFRASTLAPFDLWLIESATTHPDGGPSTTITVHDLMKLLPALSVGEWGHLKIDFNLGPASLTDTATISLGTATQILQLTPPPDIALGDRTLSIGASATAATEATKLRFDNVTYTSH